MVHIVKDLEIWAQSSSTSSEVSLESQEEALWAHQEPLHPLLSNDAADDLVKSFDRPVGTARVEAILWFEVDVYALKDQEINSKDLKK